MSEVFYGDSDEALRTLVLQMINETADTLFVDGARIDMTLSSLIVSPMSAHSFDREYLISHKYLDC